MYRTLKNIMRQGAIIPPGVTLELEAHEVENLQREQAIEAVRQASEASLVEVVMDAPVVTRHETRKRAPKADAG